MNTQAYLEGHKAYENYQHLSDCPYKYNLGGAFTDESSKSIEWERGFKEAEKNDNW